MTPERGLSLDKFLITNKPPDLVKNEIKETKIERERGREKEKLKLNSKLNPNQTANGN